MRWPHRDGGANSGRRTHLVLVDEIEQTGTLRDYYLLPATRADLLRRLDRNADAAAAYRRALELAPTDTERRFLSGRLSAVSAEPTM